ncbi:unnamed protein product [Blepharisma stoltei]|uniref:CID domain-containing protein n=1 Tax=Blepharisma stoltei TaxID=1481888 RepID=A0AAU9JHS3_9CILI|nr:unnamed protein product [Blepharisma stoltei]
MIQEFKDLLEHLDPTQEKIHTASRWCQEFLTSNPSKTQSIVDAWSKSLETSSQKIAFLFLANDIIQQSHNETLKSMFNFALPRAFTISATNPTQIQDIRKVLKVWDDRQVFPKPTIEEWEKICQRAESQLPISDRSNLIYIINLAKKLNNLKDLEEKMRNMNGEAVKMSDEECKLREDVIKEIVGVMKKIHHGNLNVSILIGRINEKLKKLDN